jgi:SNF2 family DNA or RNA helicase
MALDLAEQHSKLKALRERKDLSLKDTPLLRKTFIGLDGKETPLELRYYQVQMVFHLLAMKEFVVGDDTGCGKSLEVIAALCYLWSMYPDTKVIILAKKSAVGQWYREFEKFSHVEKINRCVAQGTPAKRQKVYDKYEMATGPTVLISGYRTMVQDFKRIQNWEGFVLVADEGTVFKNPGTQVHQVCRHLGSKAIRRWTLTATLIKNNLLEGFGIYQVIVPGLFRMTKNAFMKEFTIWKMQRVGRGRQIPVIMGYAPGHIEKFKNKIDPYYLGRPKHEVASELPVLTTKDVRVGMSRFQHEKYQEALAGLLEMGDGDLRETDRLTQIIYCQEIANHPCLIGYDDSDSEKMDTLIDLLTEGGDLEGEKVIVFTRFRTLVDWAMTHMAKKGIQCVRVTGSESDDERDAAMESFQDFKSDTQVIWITMAGGDSINLQAAKALVFYDTPWSAGDYLQILGRMIRIGSIHDRVYALHMIARGTVDTRVQQVLRKKMALIEAVLGKRLKGERMDPGDSILAISETKELFDSLVEDARGMM